MQSLGWPHLCTEAELCTAALTVLSLLCQAELWHMDICVHRHPHCLPINSADRQVTLI